MGEQISHGKQKLLLILLPVLAMTLHGCLGLQADKSGDGQPAPSLGISTSQLPQGKLQQNYQSSLVASGGTAPFVWRVVSGQMPPGLSLNNTSGAITGKPTQMGQFSFGVEVVDSSEPTHQNALKTLSVSVGADQPQITTGSLPGGRVQQAYSATLAANGGVSPYTWRMTTGTLPTGLSLNTNSGVMSGTPSQTGNFAITVEVKDAAEQTDTQALTLSVTSSSSPLQITTSSLPAGRAYTSYSVALGASGGTPPYRWRITQGQLPTGIALAENGQLSGTTTSVGGFAITTEVLDAANGSDTNALTLTVNPAAVPIVTSVSPTSGSSGGGTLVTVNGTGFINNATVKFGNANPVAATFVSSTQLRAVAPTGSAGAVVIRVTNPDTQAGQLTNAFTYLDDASPVVNAVSPTSGTVAGGNTVTILGANFSSGAIVLFGSKNATSVTIDSSTQIRAVAPSNPAGSVDLEVRNPNGKSGKRNGAYAYTAIPAPTVSGVSPTTGLTTGGQVVTVNGSNFQSGAAVKFGSLNGTGVTFVSATQLTVTTPAVGAGVVSVQVINPDGQSATRNNSFTFMLPSPTIVSLSPNSGGTGGGTQVTINGTNFVSGATAKFGGTNATGVTFVSATQLRATTPAKAAGTVAVLVTNPDGQSATTNGFSFITGPAINSLSPNSGPAVGGTQVTINGSGFASGATVKFGGTAATGVTLVSATQLRATAPAKTAGSFAVEVTNPDGQTASFSDYDYIAAPTLTSVSPTSGVTTGGTVVTLNGTGLQSGATVTFGGTNATNVTFVSVTQIRATTPAKSAGSVAVAVRNSDGQSVSLNSSFSFTNSPAPTVTSVSPSSGTIAGGVQVTINGTSFVSGATVKFDGVNATGVSFVSGSQLTATTPAHAAGAVTVQVTNPDNQTGSRATGFTFTTPPAPNITSISPTSGPTTGGTVVMVNGSNFVTGASVKFGSGNGTSVQFVSASQMRATTPAASAGTVNVVVTNPDGQTGSTNGFTYQASTPPPPGGSTQPPAGFSKVIDTGFCSTSEAGWSSGSKPPTLQQDATAPLSPPCIGRGTVPAGAGASYEPTRVEKGLGSPTAVITHAVMRMSPNWSGNPTGTNKLWFLHYGSCGDFFQARGAGSSKLTVSWERQCGGSARIQGGEFVRGQWTDLWIVNDATNGRVAMWQDGVKIADATPGYGGSRFPTFQLVSIWGGAEGTAPVTMWFDIDHMTMWTGTSVPADWAPAGGSTPPPPSGGGSPSLGPAPDANDLVVFQDDFETGDLSKWNAVDSSRYTVDSTRAKSGTRSMKNTLSSSSSSGELVKRFTGQDEVYVKFDVYWESGYQLLSYGMHWMGLMGNPAGDDWAAHGKAGIKPNGSDFFLSWVDPEPGWMGTAVNGMTPPTFYSQWPEMACPNGNPCYGNYIGQTSPKQLMTPGQWVEVVFHLKANTPGQTDGLQELWINGVKKTNQGNLRWRDTTNLKISEFLFMYYVQDGVPKTESAWIDNLLIWSPR